MLETVNLTVDYDGVRALHGVSIRVPEKSIVTIVGANGAGKSTLLKAIVGVVRPSGGSVHFEGEDVSALPTDERMARGIVLCPEGRRLFPELTVYENLRMGAYRLRDTVKIRQRLEFLYDIFPRVVERRNQMASSLSGGEQQMVAIARALMSNPRILLLDEPTLGLAPKLILEVARLVQRINQEGVTTILVEQNVKLALRVSDHAFVLETGTIALQGPSRTLMADAAVQDAYLGRRTDERSAVTR